MASGYSGRRFGSGLAIGAGKAMRRAGAGQGRQNGFMGRTGAGRVLPGATNRAGAAPPKPTPTPGRPGRPVGPPPIQAPRAGRPPVGQHFTPDAQYINDVASAQHGADVQKARSDAELQAANAYYGIDNPSDPFAQANLLKKNYLAQLSGASAGLAAQGQLYSGAHERALARVRFNQAQAEANLRKAWDAAQTKHSNAIQDIGTQTEEQKNAAFAAWLARAPDATDAAAPAAAAPAPGSPGTSTAPPTPMPRPTTATPNRQAGPGQMHDNLNAVNTVGTVQGPSKFVGAGFKTPAQRASGQRNRYFARRSANARNARGGRGGRGFGGR